MEEACTVPVSLAADCEPEGPLRVALDFRSRRLPLPIDGWQQHMQDEALTRRVLFAPHG